MMKKYLKNIVGITAFAVCGIALMAPSRVQAGGNYDYLRECYFFSSFQGAPIGILEGELSAIGCMSWNGGLVANIPVSSVVGVPVFTKVSSKKEYTPFHRNEFEGISEVSIDFPIFDSAFSFSSNGQEVVLETWTGAVVKLQRLPRDQDYTYASSNHLWRMKEKGSLSFISAPDGSTFIYENQKVKSAYSPTLGIEFSWSRSKSEDFICAGGDRVLTRRMQDKGEAISVQFVHHDSESESFSVEFSKLSDNVVIQNSKRERVIHIEGSVSEKGDRYSLSINHSAGINSISEGNEGRFNKWGENSFVTDLETGTLLSSNGFDYEYQEGGHEYIMRHSYRSNLFGKIVVDSVGVLTTKSTSGSNKRFVREATQFPIASRVSRIDELIDGNWIEKARIDYSPSGTIAKIASGECIEYFDACGRTSLVEKIKNRPEPRSLIASQVSTE